ncbi:hypothetical protein MalM25_28850 [Planctomycetes bacterium MalM25]|nr:hypothetical protein MalM25_28850 [Planctomycetes bacterium MalM25]
MSTARAGRRRRMLHEGAGATGSVASNPEPTTPSSRVRYTPRDGSASFAVASGVLPRSPLALAGVVIGLVAVTAALVWADRFSAGIATANAGVARLLSFAQPGSLAAWWEAALWLAVSVQALLLFGVRRQRTDDTRGAYRWWIVVALAALGMSLNSATHAHAAVAVQLAAVTGFSPLAGDAFWWLVPGGLILGGIAIRSLLEIKESPVAAAIGVTGFVIGSVGWLAAAGLMPGLVPTLASPLFAPAAALAAVSLASVTLLLYSRRIVREAAGEVEAPVATPKAVERNADAQELKLSAEPEPAPKPTKPKRQTVAATPEPEAEFAEPDIVPTRAAKRAKRNAALQASEEPDRWVSGAEGYNDDGYDDGPSTRKLSKAERKRLRREKARRAA